MGRTVSRARSAACAGPAPVARPDDPARPPPGVRSPLAVRRAVRDGGPARLRVPGVVRPARGFASGGRAERGAPRRGRRRGVAVVARCTGAGGGPLVAGAGPGVGVSGTAESGRSAGLDGVAELMGWAGGFTGAGVAELSGGVAEAGRTAGVPVAGAFREVGAPRPVGLTLSEVLRCTGGAPVTGGGLGTAAEGWRGLRKRLDSAPESGEFGAEIAVKGAGTAGVSEPVSVRGKPAAGPWVSVTAAVIALGVVAESAAVRWSSGGCRPGRTNGRHSEVGRCTLGEEPRYLGRPPDARARRPQKAWARPWFRREGARRPGGRSSLSCRSRRSSSRPARSTVRRGPSPFRRQRLPQGRLSPPPVGRRSPSRRGRSTCRPSPERVMGHESRRSSRGRRLPARWGWLRSHWGRPSCRWRWSTCWCSGVSPLSGDVPPPRPSRLPECWARSSWHGPRLSLVVLAWPPAVVVVLAWPPAVVPVTSDAEPLRPAVGRRTSADAPLELSAVLPLPCIPPPGGSATALRASLPCRAVRRSPAGRRSPLHWGLPSCARGRPREAPDRSPPHRNQPPPDETRRAGCRRHSEQYRPRRRPHRPQGRPHRRLPRPASRRPGPPPCRPGPPPRRPDRPVRRPKGARPASHAPPARHCPHVPVAPPAVHAAARQASSRARSTGSAGRTAGPRESPAGPPGGTP